LTARWATVLAEGGGNLSYSPRLIHIDSSAEITSLVPSVPSVKLCRTEIRFKVHFFCDNKAKFAYIWLVINFICFQCTRMSFFF